MTFSDVFGRFLVEIALGLPKIYVIHRIRRKRRKKQENQNPPSPQKRHIANILSGPQIR